MRGLFSAQQVRDLDSDDAVSILEDLDEADRAEILDRLPAAERQAVVDRTLDMVAAGL